MTEPSFLIAFGIGVLSFFSPCILPVLPGYFSYLAEASGKNGFQRRFKTLTVSLAFISGFLLVLILLGASATMVGQFLAKTKRVWQKIGGFLIVFFGLQTMKVIKGFRGFRLAILNQKIFCPLGSGGKGKAFLAGLSFGTGWTPCVGPVLGSILILASQSATLKKGIGLLIFYALGLSVPLLLSAIFLTRLRFLKTQAFSLISGGILVALGLLLFWGQYERLTLLIAQVYKFFKIPIF